MKPRGSLSQQALLRGLNTLLANAPWSAWLATDPIRFPKRFKNPADREIVALYAALIAYGRVNLIGRAVSDILTRITPTPSEALRADDVTTAQERFDGFVYRVTRGQDLARLWIGLQKVVSDFGSIGAAFTAFCKPSDEDFRSALTQFRRIIVASTSMFPDRRGFNHFLPDPMGGSAIKRYNMLLRWMIRGPDEIDLGDWRHLGTERLVLPLDTHTHRIAANLGLTNRKQANWRTASEITDKLKRLDPDDPTRFDFAIAHLGISGACACKRGIEMCTGCAISDICTLV